MKILIFDYIAALIILIVIHAPWWAWLIYFGGALLWFVIWALSDSATNKETTDEPNQE